MIKLSVSKSYLHNQKIANSEVNDNKIINNSHTKRTINVDINKLLNRVKIEEKNKKKEKLFLLSIGAVVIGIMAIFIVTVK